MSSTTASSTTFQSILDAACDSYAKQTGVELAKHPSADKLQNCRSSEDVLQILLERETAFKDYRDKHRKFLDRLRPIVQVVHKISAHFGKVADFVPFPPTKAIFVAIDILLSAALRVSSSYDALLELFECVANFLNRLHIYTEKITSSSTMSNIIVQILAEVLSVFALATKQIKEGRFKKFTKKLLGESDVEAILQRLGRLTQEEAQMTVAHTLEVVHGIFDNLKVVMADGKASTEGVQKALVTIQQTADGINRMERNQLQRDIRSWLSPPDPSVNHIIARGIYHDGTASWFAESSTFQEWKSNGSLLWIDGKPGSGKSILCSRIIHDLERLQDIGLALITYFYFDFKDAKKQEVNGFLASCITQLSAKSNACNSILSALYSKYDDGSRRPENDALMDCLTNMLKVKGQPTIYIIIDAIDECPNSPGVVRPRRRVLQMLEKLVGLQLENVRILATSRPEADIRASLGPLASQTVSLHEQEGQAKDISEYVRFYVYSDLNMRRWRDEDKKLVIDTLSQQANAMFRWMVCQLDALMDTFPSAIRRALDDLPQGLDETYDRILQSIPRAKQKFARRLFACLAVSIRPLDVEELAEILAIEFDAGAPPSYDANWRPEDPEEAVLSACSSLITIVNVDGSRVVQFSHYSVKEYLTSERLAKASHLSQYHILSHSAHTILAQASLGALLALDDKVSKEMMKNHQFAIYAARYWVDHARFEDVSLGVNDAMTRLFDATKPHFAAWVWIYDIDFPSREIMFTARPTTPEAVPLYYATLCGFGDIVKHLMATCPQDINARGGLHCTPLYAAVVKGNVELTTFFVENGADVNALNHRKRSPLYEASIRGRHEMIELLLNHNSDIDAQDDEESNALHIASQDGEQDAVRILLRHGATVDSRNNNGWTPLMFASRNGYSDIVRMLLENGATVDSRDNAGFTPLMFASRYGHPDIVRMLLENGATMDPRDNAGWIPLMYASRYGHSDIVQMLLENGATVDSRANFGWTPLMSASRFGHSDIVQMLLENGATVDSHHDDGWTPLMYASRYGHSDIVQMLLENGATVDSRANFGWTPLMSASNYGHPDIVRMLLENGATVDSHHDDGWTPLKYASQHGHSDIVRMLLENGATVDFRDNNGWTPLTSASTSGHSDIVRMLLENGATVDSRDNDGWTPLMHASESGHSDIIRMLLENGATVDSRANFGWTPLMDASKYGLSDIVRMLLENGATVDSRDPDGWTPLMDASESGHSDIVRMLLENGATVDSRNDAGWTPLSLASSGGNLEIVRLLLETGAAINSSGDISLTPLIAASQSGHLEVVRFLLQSGAAVDSYDNHPSVSLGDPDDHNFSTPLHEATINGHLNVAELLIQSGANVNKPNENRNTPLDLAAHHGRLDIAHLLLESGSSINFQDRDGSTPLHKAAENGHLDIVSLFLDNGADFNIRNNADKTCLNMALDHGKLDVARLLMGRMRGVASQDGMDMTQLVALAQDTCLGIAQPSPGYKKGPLNDESGISLCDAAQEGNLDIVRSLLDSDTNVDDRDKFHKTPLYCASRKGRVEVAKLLIQHGANVNAQTRYGWAPLHAASECGHLEVVQLLLDHGVDVDTKGEGNRTALQTASFYGHFEIVEALLKRGANVHVRNDAGRTPFQEARRAGWPEIMRLLSEHSGHGI